MSDDELRKVVVAYLSECDNPVPDYMYRWTLRNRLRGLVGAPPDPRSNKSAMGAAAQIAKAGRAT